MRLFIAIRLNGELKSAITGTMHELKTAGVQGRYVPADNLHLTLAFIGETKDAAKVRAAMQSVKWKPFRISLSSLGTFDRLLWIGIRGSQGLTGVVKALRSALEDAGISFDKKKFQPHITIVRDLSGRWQEVSAPHGVMEVGSISLMKSEEKGGKRLYTEIFSI